MEKEFKSDRIATHLSNILLKKGSEFDNEFKEWIKENDETEECLKLFSDKEKLYSALKNFNTPNKERDATQLLAKIIRRKRQRIILKTSFSTAIALLTISFLVWNNFLKPTSTPTASVIHADSVVAPKLILSDGKVIILDHNCTVNEEIKRDEQGITELSPKKVNEANNRNKLIVPSCNIHSILLSDGTKVILNANSELEFPDRFDSNERVVTLKGEGYFEVSKESTRRFIVKSNGMSVQVYGTRFNINSYDKREIRTFLIEGSISVGMEGKQQEMLKPMQLAKINTTDGHCKIGDVTEEEEPIAWIDLYFSFNCTPLQEVVKQLETWYGVTIDTSLLKEINTPITASYKRTTELDEIILTLEKIVKTKIKTSMK